METFILLIMLFFGGLALAVYGDIKWKPRISLIGYLMLVAFAIIAIYRFFAWLIDLMQKMIGG